jgi:hypothetical protein
MIEQNKKLTERYPFLLPRNIFTDAPDDDYDYTYIRGVDELPKGWEKLFLQMCEDIRNQLIKENKLHSFRFSDIKEKYNRMECYPHGCSEKIHHILDKYAYMSQFVCAECGKPAQWETHGYVLSFCDRCYKELNIQSTVEYITFVPYYKVIKFKNGIKSYHTYSFKREWKRYLDTMNEKTA